MCRRGNAAVCEYNKCEMCLYNFLVGSSKFIYSNALNLEVSTGSRPVVKNSENTDIILSGLQTTNNKIQNREEIWSLLPYGTRCHVGWSKCVGLPEIPAASLFSVDKLYKWLYFVNKELHFYELKIWNSEECFEEEHCRTAQHITQLKIPPTPGSVPDIWTGRLRWNFA